MGYIFRVLRLGLTVTGFRGWGIRCRVRVGLTLRTALRCESYVYTPN